MKIEAENRELTGKKSKTLRTQGLVPGVVFGPNIQPKNVQVDKKALAALFKKVGHSKFFDLDVEGQKPSKVLIKEIAIHPLTDEFLNVNFYQVAEDRKITVEVPINFIGDAPAIKLNLGFLITPMESIMLHCYPKDLPTELTVDISTLANTGDAITVGDIQLPENVELDSSMDASSAIVFIAAAQKEEVEEVKEPELDEEGNPIVPEGEEGAVAAEGTETAETEEEK